MKSGLLSNCFMSTSDQFFISQRHWRLESSLEYNVMYFFPEILFPVLADFASTLRCRPGGREFSTARAVWKMNLPWFLDWPSLKKYQKNPGKIRATSVILTMSHPECWSVYKNVAASIICPIDVWCITFTNFTNFVIISVSRALHTWFILHN